LLKPLKNCKIEQQDPLKISQKDFSLSKRNPKRPFKLETQSNLSFKGIVSKEIQTSIDLNDTPRFSPDFRSHVYEVQDNTYSIFYETFESEIEYMQHQIEKKFTQMNISLENFEERLSWADDTIKCIKKYKAVKRNIVKKVSVNTQTIVKKEIASTQYNNSYKELDTKSISADDPEQGDTGDKLVNMWGKICELLETGQVKQAYELVFSSNDDIYLLRIMLKTHPCLNLLPFSVSETLLGKIVGILQSRFIDNLGVEWLCEAYVLGMLNQNFFPSDFIVKVLENIINKGGNEGEAAYEIYNLLISDSDNN
jgi:hypothetical protein